MALTIFKLIAVFCAVGTPSDECRPSAPMTKTFYGGETNMGGVACLRTGPTQVAAAVSEGRIKYDPSKEYVRYVCPAYGEGKVAIPDYGIVSEPHVEVYGER